MKVVILDMLELRTNGREQLLAGPDIGIHRATDIEEHQHLHRIVTLGHHLDIEHPGIFCGTAYGVIHIELLIGASAGESAKPLECNLDVAGSQLNGVVEIPILTFIPHFDGTTIAPLAPDTDAFRMVATVPER